MRTIALDRRGGVDAVVASDIPFPGVVAVYVALPDAAAVAKDWVERLTSVQAVPSLVQLSCGEKLDQGAKSYEDCRDDGVEDVELGDEGDRADGVVRRVDGGGEHRGEGGEDRVGDGDGEHLEGGDEVDEQEEEHDGAPGPGVEGN